jgi:hypothetical protein
MIRAFMTRSSFSATTACGRSAGMMTRQDHSRAADSLKASSPTHKENRDRREKFARAAVIDRFDNGQISHPAALIKLSALVLNKDRNSGKVRISEAR